MMKHIRSSPCLHQGPKSPSGDLPNGRQSLFSQCQWLMDVLWDTEWKALAAVCASAFCHSEELTCLRNCSRFEKLWLAWESWNRTIMFRPYHDHATYCNLKAFHEINLRKTCWPKVFNLMQGHQESVRGTRHLSLLNQEICNRGFMRLLGLGKHRFQTIASASRAGLDKCPMDERFLPRAAKEPSVKRQAVYDFLHALWEQAGETLPDPNHTGSNKRPRQGQHRFDDKSLPRTDLRHIPPGKFMDYLRLCRLENPDLLISRKLFTSVSHLQINAKLLSFSMFVQEPLNFQM